MNAADGWTMNLDDCAVTPKTPEQAALAWRVIDQIEAEPKAHRQEWWLTVTACGTQACYAGWASLLAGDEIAVENAEPGWSGTGERSWVRYTNRNGVVVSGHVSERARDLLGLDIAEGSILFSGANSLRTLRGMVERLYGPRPPDPA